MLKALFLFVVWVLLLGGVYPSHSFEYGEEVHLPACKEDDPEVLFIRHPEDWDNINDEQYNVFCVLPGDYSSAGPIELKASGKASKKRWVRWYDPHDPNNTATHPVDMGSSQQAVLKQICIGGMNSPDTAQHWVVDRLVIRGSGGPNQIANGSSNNTLNRLLIEGCDSAFFIFRDSRRNILQNSVLRNARMVPGSDRCLIYFSENEGDRVVNNELRNPAGGGCVQQGPLSRSGNVIFGNDCYISQDRYADCNGQLDPAGACAAGEQGIVIKGPRNSKEPLIIAENRIWGFQECDTKLAGTGHPGTGIDIGSGNKGVNKVIIKENIIFDVSYGIYLARNTHHIVIDGNILYNIKKKDESTAISNTYGHNVIINGNTIIDSTYWYRGSHLNENLRMSNNVIINCDAVHILGEMSDTEVIGTNYIYPPSLFRKIAARFSHFIQLKEDTPSKDRCFDIQRFTSVKTKCIPVLDIR